MTNVHFASLHRLRSALSPLDHAGSTAQNRALVTSDIRSSSRMSGGFHLRLDARRCASASWHYALLSASAPLPASRPQTEAPCISHEASRDSRSTVA